MPSHATRSPRSVLVGVISDTHGGLPEWVEETFDGVDLIVHAGDVGSPQILRLLGCIAPVRAVRGNTDSHGELAALPHHLRFDVAGASVLVVHELHDVPRLLEDAPADVVIFGHTHRPRVQRAGESLAVNPGSPNRSRGEGHSVALLSVESGVLRADIVRH